MGTLVVAAATAGLVVIAAFQVALAAGAPWGRAAWGGRHAGRLPGSLRAGSAIAAVVWALAAVAVAARIEWATWVLVGLLALGTLMNLASSSPWERFGWAPFSATLAALCIAAASRL